LNEPLIEGHPGCEHKTLSKHTPSILLEEQYQRLDEIMDDVAERIRSLGHCASAALKGYRELTHLSEQGQVHK
jgi:starvation-inducible DNA-binding protein